MSRLWPDQLSIAIAPDRIVLVRGSGGFRPHLLAKATVPLSGATNGWKTALEALAKTLKSESQWQQVATTVILSNSFVRYQLVPSSDEISSPEEREAFIRQSYTQVYGDVAAEWVFVLDDAIRGAAWMACAIDRDLLRQLEETISQAGSKLVSVKPHIMPAFNGIRRMIKQKDYWFVQIEKDKMLLALITGGHWQTISSRQIVGERWQQELPLLLDREWRMNGMSQVPREVIISAPEAHQAAMDGEGKWVFLWLRPTLRYGLSGRADAPFAIAVGA